MTLQDQMLEQGYNSGDPTRRAAAIAAGYTPPGGSTLSGTGTPLPGGTPSLPSSGGAAPTGGSLIAFSAALEQAVKLARENRNKSSLNLMAPYQGTVRASDFNSILSNMNTASDKSSSDLIDRATKANAPDIITTVSDNGVVHGIDKSTGKVIWQTAPGTGNVQGGADGKVDVTSGDLVVSTQDIQQGNVGLKASSTQGTEADGKYADPNVYLSMYKHWITSGGTENDFFKFYPLSVWINPTNTWLTKSLSDYNLQSKRAL